MNYDLAAAEKTAQKQKSVHAIAYRKNNNALKSVKNSHSLFHLKLSNQFSISHSNNKLLPNELCHNTIHIGNRKQIFSRTRLQRKIGVPARQTLHKILADFFKKINVNCIYKSYDTRSVCRIRRRDRRTRLLSVESQKRNGIFR